MSQKLVFLVWMTFLFIIMTIFSTTMQDTETKLSQFILEGIANSNMVSNCQYNIWFMFYLQLKC